MALGVEEGVGHAAADGQRVQLGDQVVEQVELGGDLGAADDADHGPPRGPGRVQAPPARAAWPAGIGGQRRARPSVEAWARWAAEKASLT